MQIKLLPLIDSIRNVLRLTSSSFVSALGKLGERTRQLWRDSSRRVRTHEKKSGETVRRLGTIIQLIFCAQSGACIRYSGALPPMLENFRRNLGLRGCAECSG